MNYLVLLVAATTMMPKDNDATRQIFRALIKYMMNVVVVLLQVDE